MNFFNNVRRYLRVLLAIALSAPAAHAAQPFGCLIEAERSADVGSQVVGIIESIPVDRGDQVKKGQVLAVLQAQSERAAVAVAQVRSSAEGELRAAEAAARLAKQNLARTENLFQRNFVSRSALDQANSEADIALQKIAQARDNKRAVGTEAAYARAQLGQRTIVAPFDGIVTERYMVAGERVEDKPIVRIVQIDPLRVQVVVPVTMYGQIKIGSSAEVRPELPGAAPVNAEVSGVDMVVDPASNTFRAMLRIDNSDHALPAGLRCLVDFSKGTVLASKKEVKTAAVAETLPAEPVKTVAAAPASVPAAAPVAATTAAKAAIETPKPKKVAEAPTPRPVAKSAPAKTVAAAPPVKRVAATTPSKPAPKPVAPARAVAVQSAEPASVTPVAHARADVGAHLYAWLSAWRNKDIAVYLASYADDFLPPRNLSREAWREARRQNVVRPDAIDIHIDNLQIAAVAADELRTTFVQHYRSGDYSDSGSKELLWRKEGGRWLIVSERQL